MRTTTVWWLALTVPWGLRAQIAPIHSRDEEISIALSAAPARIAARAAVDALRGRRAVRDYHLDVAVRGHLLQQLGRTADAAECFRAALDMRCSEPERRLLKRKLAECRARRRAEI